MNKPTSLYLDFLRLTAAVAVFIAHLQGFLFPNIPSLVASHADEAVCVFFVLSGFVIGHVLHTKEDDYRSYAAARFTRIFSVVLIALMTTYVADTIGYSLNPAYYDAIRFYNGTYASVLPFALTFSTEYWFGHQVFGTNEAYWSLGFEVPYYIAAGLLMFLPTRFAYWATLVLAMIVGPKIAVYGLIWLLGFMTYRIARSGYRPRHALIVFCITPFLYLSAKYFLHDLKGQIYIWTGPVSFFHGFLYYLSIALITSLNILAFVRLSDGRVVSLPRVANAVRWLAGASFTLYLTNEPLLVLAAAATPNHWLGKILAVALLLVVVLFLAELGERRKDKYKAVFAHVFRRIAVVVKPAR